MLFLWTNNVFSVCKLDPFPYIIWVTLEGFRGLSTYTYSENTWVKVYHWKDVKEFPFVEYSDLVRNSILLCNECVMSEFHKLSMEINALCLTSTKYKNVND